MKDKILLLGNLASVLDSLTEEVRAVGFVPIVAPSAEDAFTALAGDGVFAVVYEAGASAVESVCTTVRGNPRFDRVPLIAFVSDVGEKVLAPVFASGADDYLPLGERGDLEDKLRDLRAAAASGGPSFVKARAIVADVDRQRRVQFARTLRQSSYDIHFALDGEEVSRVLEADETIQVVVADAELPPAGCVPILESLRKAGRERPVWIVSGPSDWRHEIEPQLMAQKGAGFHDRGASPENLMFTINAVSLSPARSLRQSARILHGAPVSFRIEGRNNLVWGSTFNISRAGLYIRTLTAPPFGSILRIRLNAPAGGPRVEIRARVVWRKQFGAENAMPGPAGMGLQLVDGEAFDRAEFEAGYDRLVSQHQKAELAA